MRSIELAFPVVHGSLIDAVSEYDVIVVDVDVTSVNGGALVCVFAQELELGDTKVCDVEVGIEGLDVGHVVDVHLSHLDEQGCTVNGVKDDLGYGIRDVLGESPARACAAAGVDGVMYNLG